MNKPERSNPYDGMIKIQLNKRFDEWEKYNKEEYDLPLQRLTPQGSEFIDNPKRCFEYIKDRLKTGFKAKKNVVKVKKINKELLVALEEAYSYLNKPQGSNYGNVEIINLIHQVITTNKGKIK